MCDFMSCRRDGIVLSFFVNESLCLISTDSREECQPFSRIVGVAMNILLRFVTLIQK